MGTAPVKRLQRLPGPVLAACAATLVLLLGQAFSFPGLVRDAVTGGFPGYGLEFPVGYVFTAPFSALADLLTFNSARQHVVWAVYLVLAFVAWRVLKNRGKRLSSRDARIGFLLNEGGCLLLYFGALAVFLIWTALGPRPAARLSLPGDILAIDFHSHTSSSRDARRSFSPQKNVAWHRVQGFGAGFITDHNLVEGSLEAFEYTARRHPDIGYRSLPGEEVSLHDAHIVVLGNTELIDNKPFNANLGGLKRFLHYCRIENKGLPVLSLPEYWKHHWARLELLMRWGARGVEVVNSSPKSLDFPPDKFREVVELARRHNLFLTGVSDSHGWGNAVFTWSLMSIPDHSKLGPEELREEVLGTLHLRGFEAVRVVTRLKHQPAQGLGIVLDPIASLWVLSRSLTGSLTAVSLLWAWLLAGAAMFARGIKV